MNHANDSKGSTGTNKVVTTSGHYTQNYVPYDFVDEKHRCISEVAVLKAIDEKLPDYKFEYTEQGWRSLNRSRIQQNTISEPKEACIPKNAKKFIIQKNQLEQVSSIYCT